MTRTQLINGIAVTAALSVAAVFFIFNPFTVIGDNALSSAASSFGEGSAGFMVQDQMVGVGETARPGDMVSVSYTGRLENGSVFDTSVGKTPYRFTLGAGEVIAGWDQGIVGMKVGGKRTLVIPPSLAYGSNGIGSIPPNSTLYFDVELVSVTPSVNTNPFSGGIIQ